MPCDVHVHVHLPAYFADQKDGGSPCGYVDGVATDNFGVYQYAYDLFESAGAPVVYTPGDNEWTDW